MERGTAWLRVARDSFFTKHFGRYRETASLPTLGFGCCPPNKHQGRKTSAKLGLTHPSFTLEPLDPNLIGKQGTLVARPPGEVPEGLALPSDSTQAVTRILECLSNQGSKN